MFHYNSEKDGEIPGFQMKLNKARTILHCNGKKEGIIFVVQKKMREDEIADEDG